MDDDERVEFRDALTRFVRTYSFVSQIAAFTDPVLEADYVFCRALSSYMRDAGTVERLDLGSEVELTHLRHQMTFSGSLELTSETGEVRSFFGEGRGSQQELDLEHQDWLAGDELSDQAKSNSLDNFGLAFNRKFLDTIIARVDTNDEIFKKILDDEEFKSAVEGYYLRKVYNRLRETSESE